MKTLLIILIAICSLSCPLGATAQNKTVKDSYIILVYGYPKSNTYINARNVVAQKWKIEYNRIANCSVGQHLFDSIDVHNDSIYDRIAIEFGSDWKEKYNNEIEKELEKQSFVIDLVKKQSFIMKLDSTLAANDIHFRDYLIDGTEKDSVYRVIVYGYGNWDGDRKLLSYFDLKVNLIKEQVDLVSDEPKLLFPE